MLWSRQWNNRCRETESNMLTATKIELTVLHVAALWLSSLLVYILQELRSKAIAFVKGNRLELRIKMHIHLVLTRVSGTCAENTRLTWGCILSPIPSDILKNAFDELGGKTPSDDDITKIAKKTLLSTDKVIIWLDQVKRACSWKSSCYTKTE